MSISTIYTCEVHLRPGPKGYFHYPAEKITPPLGDLIFVFTILEISIIQQYI